jgi:hypothetical protein
VGYTGGQGTISGKTFLEERGCRGMQKNKVKKCCQAEADAKQEENGHEPVAHHHKNASFGEFFSPLPLFCRFFFVPSRRHLNDNGISLDEYAKITAPPDRRNNYLSLLIT